MNKEEVLRRYSVPPESFPKEDQRVHEYVETLKVVQEPELRVALIRQWLGTEPNEEIQLKLRGWLYDIMVGERKEIRASKLIDEFGAEYDAEADLSMQDLAEIWALDKEMQVPPRGTDEWREMYEEWYRDTFRDPTSLEDDDLPVPYSSRRAGKGYLFTEGEDA